MKTKSFFAVSLLVAGAAFAAPTEIESTSTIGVMPLSVGQETIINIPWVESGSAASGNTIAVANIIKTANLSAGDELYYYNGSAYEAWKVNSTATAWESITVSTATGITLSDTHESTLSRGKALILNRVVSFATKPTLTIYVVGQTSEQSASVTISQGYNIFAPTAVSGTTDLVAKIGNNAQTGDQLILGGTDRYTFNGTKWVKPTYNASTYTWGETQYDAINLNSGNGAFYYRAGDDEFTISNL